MEEQRESSLDRFMRTRGAMMLGSTAYKRSSATQIGIGGFLAVFGLCMLIAPAFGGDPNIAPGAIGPIIAGVVNILVGTSMRRRFGYDASMAVQLTPEAKGLLMALHRRLNGWWMPWVHPGMGLAAHPSWSGSPFAQLRSARRARRMAMWTGVTPEMVPDDLDDSELQYLERVAAKYNRTIGALESGKASSATLAKLAPRIMKAADEAMAESLHQAAMLVKYPEGGASARSRLEAQEKSLQELADRVESMAAGQPGITDKVAYRSSIDDVLDELRLEQLARSELRSENEPNQEVRE